MYFEYYITIPAGTTEDSPVVQTLKLTRGIIRDIVVQMQYGTSLMVGVRFFHREFQLVPLSKGEWVRAEGTPIHTETFFKLLHKPFALKFHGCSPGTTHKHDITVAVKIEPEAVASFEPLLNLFYRISRTGLYDEEEE